MVPLPSPSQIRSYRERGWLLAEGVVPLAELAELRRRCAVIRERPPWLQDVGAMETGEPVFLGILEMVWIEWRRSDFHAWTCAAASALAGAPMDYWYDQLLIKPPGVGAPTAWHQDGAALKGDHLDFLLTAWLNLEAVAEEDGCLRFVDGAHVEGAIAGLQPTGGAYGVADWDPSPRRVSTCAAPAGSVSFHHGFTPHSAGPNRGEGWRMALIQRFTREGIARPTGH